MKIPIRIFIASFIFITACSKNNNSTSTPPSKAPAPAASVLSLPLNNTVCLSGAAADANNTIVNISWQAANNAETYDLYIKNLVTNKQTVYHLPATTYSATLAKSQPYSWWVISQSSATTATAQSDVWKFYVAGAATSNYAPFPATIITPATKAVIASAGLPLIDVLLKWDAADIDNDIVSYTIYLDDTNASVKLIPFTSNKTATTQLAAGKNYYWRVVTTDAAGNSSDSGTYSFSIQ